MALPCLTLIAGVPVLSGFLTKLPLYLSGGIAFLFLSLSTFPTPSILPKGLAWHKIGGNSFQLFYPVSHCSGIPLVAALLKTATAAPVNANRKHCRRSLVNITASHSERQPLPWTTRHKPWLQRSWMFELQLMKMWKATRKHKSTMPMQPRHTAHLLPAVSYPCQNHFQPQMSTQQPRQFRKIFLQRPCSLSHTGKLQKSKNLFTMKRWISPYHLLGNIYPVATTSNTSK